jgi:hypothetical protein
MNALAREQFSEDREQRSVHAEIGPLLARAERAQEAGG